MGWGVGEGQEIACPLKQRCSGSAAMEPMLEGPSTGRPDDSDLSVKETGESASSSGTGWPESCGCSALTLGGEQRGTA